MRLSCTHNLSGKFGCCCCCYFLAQAFACVCDTCIIRRFQEQNVRNKTKQPKKHPRLDIAINENFAYVTSRRDFDLLCDDRTHPVRQSVAPLCPPIPPPTPQPSSQSSNENYMYGILFGAHIIRFDKLISGGVCVCVFFVSDGCSHTTRLEHTCTCTVVCEELQSALNLMMDLDDI